MKVLEQVRFDDKGLIPAIAQDFETEEILMFAWMNQESLSLTIKKNKQFTILVHAKNCGLKAKNQDIHNLLKLFI
ncbi:[similarity to] phosphoribosyl-AMPcyclohydrolase [Bathymodiolus azoricus thioautotrophic gill symbiont]|uniref:[similarity to] phosphoribosyl-AMPcyclohydrolase n=1 Tax=Bathymodiolus azoricus thioautotrophic gill symbiont TaxID=235205 RepID=A0A1H6LVF0_9GAMM|nr:[similarity to] phosphoribosyl-AMPcyclohydrolase [Bathymodiolus azoricus thioautotrophic gill symbiont]